MKIKIELNDAETRVIRGRLCTEIESRDHSRILLQDGIGQMVITVGGSVLTDLTDSAVPLVRETLDNYLAPSKPCPKCGAADIDDLMPLEDGNIFCLSTECQFSYDAKTGQKVCDGRSDTDHLIPA